MQPPGRDVPCAESKGKAKAPDKNRKLQKIGNAIANYFPGKTVSVTRKGWQFVTQPSSTTLTAVVPGALA